MEKEWREKHDWINREASDQMLMMPFETIQQHSKKQNIWSKGSLSAEEIMNRFIHDRFHDLGILRTVQPSVCHLQNVCCLIIYWIES